MVPPATVVAAKNFRVQFYSSLQQRRTARLQTVVAKPELHRFLISGPNLRIDANFSSFPPSSVHRFLISGPDLGIDASFSSFTPSFVHRFLISRPDLGIDVSFSPLTPSFVHRFLISGPDLRIDAASSLLQLRTARLQRSRGVQAGTGCHEGGIILSKKPPEWRLSLPYQRPASDSDFRRLNEEWPAWSSHCLNEGRYR